MITTDNAQKTLSDLLIKLSDPNIIAEFFKKELFTEHPENIPSTKWSKLNRLLMFCYDTQDARGFKQWKEAGRNVKKGAHAIYILVPMFRKLGSEKEENKEEGNEIEEDQKILSGYRTMPVFRVEDTEGAALDYQIKLNSFDPSRFPLYKIALDMGIEVSKNIITVKAAYGFFDPEKEAITLGTSDVTTFFHELSHAIDNRISPLEIKGDYALDEIVAELSSCLLCHLYNQPAHIEHTKAYMQKYGGPHTAMKIVTAIERVEKIVIYIQNREEKQAPGK